MNYLIKKTREKEKKKTIVLRGVKTEKGFALLKFKQSSYSIFWFSKKPM